MKWWKKMEKLITEPEKTKKLAEWQKKYAFAKEKYADTLNDMRQNEKYYEGDRELKASPNSNQPAKKKSVNVRNICYELIESQVDSSIPMPKVIPVHEDDLPKARIIEEFLKNEIQTLDLKGMNDMQERTTPIQGGSFTLIEWDNTKGYHCTIGDISVEDIHPREIIPQPGIIDIDEMDYIFVRTPQTKEYIKRRFGKDVKLEDETDKDIREDVENEDIVTLITAYYKNEDNGIGIYRWCGDTELEDLSDYEARHQKVCKKCGRVKDADVCPDCGSKTFEDKVDELDEVVMFETQQVDVAMDGTPIFAEREIRVQIPYYKPQKFPIVLRKNISRDKYLLGFSDVSVIADQQDTIKKLGSNINEKLIKGGSFVTLPDGLGVETTDEQLKIIRVPDPAKKALIDVINVQPDISKDLTYLETNYQWAKSALGITDAYQGKYDSSATSGAAKQYSINQAAGRLESKRVMKNRAYAKIFELMFKFALAYADQPIPINVPGKNGELTFAHFDKKDFLKQDSSGEWYWNDEFIFDVDPTSTLLTNREAMWNQDDLKLQSGAFGQLGDLETNYLYWLEQERNGYPNAGEIKNEIKKRLDDQKQIQMQMAQMSQIQALQNGGVQNEMPNM